MTEYVVAALISVTLYSTYVIIQKLALKYLIKNPLVFHFYSNFFSLVLILPFLVIKNIGIPKNFTWVVLNGVSKVVSYLCFLYALKRTDVSIISPLSNLRTVFSTLMAVFLLGEVLPMYKYWWIALTIFAGLFVSMDEKLSIKSFFKKEVLIFLVALFFVSLSSIFVNKGIAELDFWTYNIWYYIFAFLFTIPTVPFIKQEINIGVKKFVLLAIIGVIPLASTLFQNKAMAENVTISTVIFALPGSMILAFIISKLKPKLLEIHSIKVYIIRFIAAAIMVIATLQII